MALDDALDDGQPDPGAGKLAGSVQTLEHAEQTIRVFRIEPHAVVANADRRLAVEQRHEHVHRRRCGMRGELECVRHQVEDHLPAASADRHWHGRAVQW
jgi:hypothetical protein